MQHGLFKKGRILRELRAILQRTIGPKHQLKFPIFISNNLIINIPNHIRALNIMEYNQAILNVFRNDLFDGEVPKSHGSENMIICTLMNIEGGEGWDELFCLVAFAPQLGQAVLEGGVERGAYSCVDVLHVEKDIINSLTNPLFLWPN